ncbi:DNA methyltransferase [Aliarcobacter skirrowii]|uniref:DNA-methyltransferase n=1 Tax=Aliarcobacter skirrowii TaxID=28200 RepID=UPI0029AACC68|nr:DNA methyltransferase [Aliarcobacter skirrowii]MDX4050348.1 DNA methyltransferase [Aliarcobacter skirrowii]
MINKIIHGDCIEILKKLDNESVDLIIADPPYWKVVGEKWDYKWRTLEDYIEWSILWLNQIERVLRKGGTFYLFGYFRTLVYLIPELDKLNMELRQQIIINKGMQSVSGRATKNYKIFPNVTESILFFVKDSKPFIKDFLKQRQKELGLSSKQINELLGVKSNGGGMWSIYTGKNICKQVPTRELWEKLKIILKFDIPYENISITFNSIMGITDVWDDISFYEKNRIHPTQKPYKLIERLILASSNENDLVLDPFSGSGTTALVAKQLNRNFIGIEIDEEYKQSSEERLAKVLIN